MTEINEFLFKHMRERDIGTELSSKYHAQISVLVIIYERMYYF